MDIESGKSEMQFNTEAKNWLMSMKEKNLNLVCIVGPSRIGKSTLMSKLFGDREVSFETNADANVPCTDGIMALRNPIKERDLNMILMDCKGFNNAHDAKGESEEMN